MGISYHLTLMSLAVGFSGTFQQGYLMSVLNQPYKQIEDYIKSSIKLRTGDEVDDGTVKMLMSALIVVNPLATIIGQMMALWLCNRIGRKNAALIGCMMNFPGILISLGAKWLHPTCEALFFGRLIWSIANGILIVNQTIWLIESAPTKHRGSISTMQEVFSALGSLATTAVGIPFSNETLWPTMFAFPLIINILCIIAFCMVPESPQFLLLNQNSPAEASRAIAKYHGLTDETLIAEQISTCLLNGAGTSQQQKSTREPKTGAMDVIFRPWKASDEMSRVLRHGAWIGLMVKIAYLFTGTRCIRTYNTFVLKDLGEWDGEEAKFYSLAISLLRIPFTIVPVYLVDRIGRRPLLLWSAGSSVVFLTMIAFSILEGDDFKMGTLIGVTCLLTVNTMGLGSVSRLYAAELVPHKLLLKSVSVLAIIEALVRVALEFSFYPLAASIDAGYFPIFIIPSMIFFIIIWFCCPETKGRSINDVLNELAKFKKAKVTFQT